MGNENKLNNKIDYKFNKIMLKHLKWIQVKASTELIQQHLQTKSMPLAIWSIYELKQFLHAVEYT